ncbi:MAG: Zn-ribbon domain-containing OB-fold protein [Rhodospirillales bacterium]
MKQFGSPVYEPHIAKDDAGSIKLAGGCCDACGVLSFPRAQVCVECLSENIKILAMPDHGVLYSYSIVRVGRIRDRVPYAVGYIDLENGIRLFSHFSDIAALEVDLPVSIKIEPVGEAEDGAPLYQFWAAPRNTTNA